MEGWKNLIVGIIFLAMATFFLWTSLIAPSNSITYNLTFNFSKAFSSWGFFVIYMAIAGIFVLLFKRANILGIILSVILMLSVLILSGFSVACGPAVPELLYYLTITFSLAATVVFAVYHYIETKINNGHKIFLALALTFLVLGALNAIAFIIVYGGSLGLGC